MLIQEKAENSFLKTWATASHVIKQITKCPQGEKLTRITGLDEGGRKDQIQNLMCLKKETIKVLTGKNHSNSEQRRNFPDSNITGHNSQDMANKKKKGQHRLEGVIRT